MFYNGITLTSSVKINTNIFVLQNVLISARSDYHLTPLKGVSACLLFWISTVKIPINPVLETKVEITSLTDNPGQRWLHKTNLSSKTLLVVPPNSSARPSPFHQCSRSHSVLSHAQPLSLPHWLLPLGIFQPKNPFLWNLKPMPHFSSSIDL